MKSKSWYKDNSIWSVPCWKTNTVWWGVIMLVQVIPTAHK